MIGRSAALSTRATLSGRSADEATMQHVGYPRALQQWSRSSSTAYCFLRRLAGSVTGGTVDRLLLTALSVCILVLASHAVIAGSTARRLAHCRTNAIILKQQLQTLDSDAAAMNSTLQMYHNTLRSYQATVWAEDNDSRNMHKDLKRVAQKFATLRHYNLQAANMDNSNNEGGATPVARVDALVHELGVSLDKADALLAAEDETINLFRKLVLWVK